MGYKQAYTFYFYSCLRERKVEIPMFLTVGIEFMLDQNLKNMNQNTGNPQHENAQRQIFLLHYF